MSQELTKKQAIDKLWRLGNLEWKLLGKQREIKKYLKENSEDVSVILCSRRFGKSFILLCWAVEECIKIPNAIVKYACPEKIMIVNNLNPDMERILEDCPIDIKPNWMPSRGAWIFPNGSQIQLAGTDKGHVEKLRGGASHLCICDEAGYMSDLSYVVNSVMAPTTDTTNGKIVLASTPNAKDPNHEFHTEYIHPLQAQNKIAKFTVYDSPMVTEKKLQKIIARYPQGIDDPKFKCEYLCEMVVANDAVVIPEFTPELERDIVTENDMPVYYHAYVSGDPATVDLTGVLFAYHDFIRGKLVIVDELVLGGKGYPDVTTDDISSGIKRKEAMYFRNPMTKELIKPKLRIMDNNFKILIHDLYKLHGMEFIPTAKDNKQAQINTLRIMLKNGQIEIHPRCKNLIYHIRSAQWDKNSKEFQRVRQTKDYREHHCDLLDALIYLIRNVDMTSNPYPANYFDNYNENWYVPEHLKNKAKSNMQDFMGKMFNIKRK